LIVEDVKGPGFRNVVDILDGSPAPHVATVSSTGQEKAHENRHAKNDDADNKARHDRMTKEGVQSCSELAAVFLLVGSLRSQSRCVTHYTDPRDYPCRSLSDELHFEEQQAVIGVLLNPYELVGQR
jgi:hypothetical protein